jgi:hypothetical protein
VRSGAERGATAGDRDPGPQYQEFRVADETFGWILVLMALGAVALLIKVGTDEAPGVVKVVAIVPGLAAFAVLPVWAWLSRTVKGPDGIVVRGLFRTKSFAWPDIQDIRSEASPAALFGHDGPRHIVILYDGAGRRVALPHVNEKNLGFTFATEVEAMRVVWQQRRGPQWVPVPRAQRTIDQYRRYTFSSSTVGLIAGSLSVGLAVMLVLIGLFTGASELPAPLSWPFAPAVIWVLPIVVSVGAIVFSKLARRRAIRRDPFRH